MTTVVSIARRALQMLGADSIIDLTEDNNRARAMQIAYEPVRDAELTRNRWRFSFKRASLAALSTAPVHGFGYAYQPPTDFLRLIGGGDLGSYPDMSDIRADTNELYSLENGLILTNLTAPLKIRYIARITDASLFDAAFAEMLAARLAMETCERLTQSDSKKQIAAAFYKDALKSARRANALQGAVAQLLDDTWVSARGQ